MKRQMGFLVLLLSTISAVSVEATTRRDPCVDAAYRFAVTRQHQDYRGAAWKRSQPGSPNVNFYEGKANGFEIWTVEYSVDEECLEGYQLLVRRSGNGLSCAAIKEASTSSRDCG